MRPVSEMYTEVKDRFAGLVADLGDSDLNRWVPACPEWTVHDLLRHVTAGIAEARAGGSPEFTGGLDVGEHWRDPDVADALDRMLKRQLHERRDASVGALLDEWSAATEQAVAMLDGQQPWPAPWTSIEMGYVLLNDVVVHECDLRDALEIQPPSDHDALWVALLSHVAALDTRLRTLARPALELHVAGRTLTAGERSPAASVTATPYEALMMLTGRRTADQITTLRWQGSPLPYLDSISSYEQPVPHESGSA